jgi:hypothetical protein
MKHFYLNTLLCFAPKSPLTLEHALIFAIHEDKRIYASEDPRLLLTRCTRDRISTNPPDIRWGHGNGASFLLSLETFYKKKPPEGGSIVNR